MTWEELERVEAYLKENGYRKGGKPYHCNADHYWYKAFGRIVTTTRKVGHYIKYS